MAVKSRTALVTGSGRNIGRACAITLAGNGFDVAVNGSKDRAICEALADEIRSMDCRAEVFMADVGIKKDVEAMTRNIFAEFGGVDVLINNAAIRPGAGFLEIQEEDWNRVIDVNFNAAFWLSRLCLPGMIERGWGRIINFAGMNAMAGYPGKPYVTVSKHAVWGLTKSLAKEFGPNGITCNLISPGTIVGESATEKQQERANELKPGIPVGRLGTPEDIASAVSLLCSDGGGFINGQLLQINGGVVC